MTVLFSVYEANEGARRRTINPRKMKLVQEKRYSQLKGYNFFTACGRFNCKRFSPNDYSFIQKQLLSVPNQTAQGNYVAKLISLNVIKR